jgi:hypothetical protein
VKDDQVKVKIASLNLYGESV